MDQGGQGGILRRDPVTGVLWCAAWDTMVGAHTTEIGQANKERMLRKAPLDVARLHIRTRPPLGEHAAKREWSLPAAVEKAHLPRRAFVHSAQANQRRRSSAQHFAGRDDFIERDTTKLHRGFHMGRVGPSFHASPRSRATVNC